MSRARSIAKKWLLGTAAVPAAFVFTGVLMPRDHCFDKEAGGCADPTGTFTCLVTADQSHGYRYWPHQQVDGDACMKTCPNAHCHGEEEEDPQFPDTGLVQRTPDLQQQVETAVRANDAAALARLARLQPGLAINVERQAIQYVSACAKEVVLAHHMLAPQLFKEVLAEYSRPLNRALGLVGWMKARHNSLGIMSD